MASRRASRTVVEIILVPAGMSGSWSCADAPPSATAWPLPPLVGAEAGFSAALSPWLAGEVSAELSEGAAGAASTALASSPSSASIAMTALTFTFSVPSATSSLATTPSSTASTSIVALSVSISAITMPEVTLSPSLIFHLASVPSSMVGERAGMRISIDIGQFLLAVRASKRLNYWRLRACSAKRARACGWRIRSAC